MREALRMPRATSTAPTLIGVRGPVPGCRVLAETTAAGGRHIRDAISRVSHRLMARGRLDCEHRGRCDFASGAIDLGLTARGCGVHRPTAHGATLIALSRSAG